LPNDVIVYTRLDSKPKPAEAMSILVLQTTGIRDPKIYRDYKEMLSDNYLDSSEAYKAVVALFDQGKTTLADRLIRKVKVAGIDVAENAAPTELVAAVEEFRQQDDNWHILLTDRTDLASITALCAWAECTEPTEAELGAGVEDHRKFYFSHALFSDLFAPAGDGSLSSTVLLIPNKRRCAGIAAASSAEQTAPAYIGNVGPFYPRSVTWKFKRPAGIELPDLTKAQREALEEANWNFLTDEYGKIYVKNGVCFDGEFIDNQLGADWITEHMREELYHVYLVNEKVPYDDEGFSMVGAAVLATLNAAVALHILAKDPQSKQGRFRVTIPTRADATDEQARRREMPPIFWEAEFEGAVHSSKSSGVLYAALPA
jgi:hypothetical protein